jgi:CheY-like chemotaxis protein
MEKEGWFVTEAVNGLDALSKLAEARPELILTDIMMPEVDGFGFVATLREDERYHHIPVVVLTAKDLSADDHARLAGKVSAVFQKGDRQRQDILVQVRRLVPPAELPKAA